MLAHYLVIEEVSHYVEGMDLASRTISSSPCLHHCVVFYRLFYIALSLLVVCQTFSAAATPRTSEWLFQWPIPIAECPLGLRRAISGVYGPQELL